MDFSDHLKAIASRIDKQTPHLQTEAATSAALVLPFIRALGYEVFDPTEVVPEFTADVGTKKGEKVDYAILGPDGEPIILFEVKCWNVDLDETHASQLYRYFSVTRAVVAVLTNGIIYRFYTDLEEPNKMDERPFLVVDLRALKDAHVDELKRFTKSRFDAHEVVTAASELKYTNGIKGILASEYEDPSEELVRFFAKQVYSGLLTKAAREQFHDIVKRAFHQFINDRINDRLQSALASEEARSSAAREQRTAESQELPEGIASRDGEVVTTDEEVEGYNIVKAILAAVVDPKRVVIRDTKSYCGVLLDNNNRKPICRLRFNATQKYIGVFDAEKTEHKFALESLEDIYKYAEQLKLTPTFYDAQ